VTRGSLETLSLAPEFSGLPNLSLNDSKETISAEVGRPTESSRVVNESDMESCFDSRFTIAENAALHRLLDLAWSVSRFAA
jgi:hypothetical protein